MCCIACRAAQQPVYDVFRMPAPCAGYCQISCGRCDCCPSLAAAAEQAGLTEFLWAMNRSTTHVEDLNQPGLMATVLAPDNNAMQTLFDKLGKTYLPHALLHFGMSCGHCCTTEWRE